MKTLIIKISMTTLLCTSFLACATASDKAGGYKSRFKTVTDGTCIAGTEVGFIHLNDVYEINPVNNGTEGGLARVATYVSSQKKINKNTYSVMAGDFFNPSAMGSLKLKQKGATEKSTEGRFAGRQMVDVLNTVPLDFATFGNHEFDLKKEEFIERLQESKFPYVTSNVHLDASIKAGDLRKTQLIEVAGVDGTPFKVGLFGITIDKYKPDYVTFGNYDKSTEEAIADLRGKGANAVIAITHLSKADDRMIGDNHEGISLIMGGHEHNNMYFRTEKTETIVAKADSNARTVYHHRVCLAEDKSTVVIKSELVKIDSKFKPALNTQVRVAYWNEMAEKELKKSGFSFKDVLGSTPVELDGMDMNVRFRETELTKAITNAMKMEFPKADAAFMIAGFIRIDDVIKPGPITVYDAFRVLPFTDKTVLYTIKGSDLLKVMSHVGKDQGSGKFLHAILPKEPVDPEKTYKIVVNEYMTKAKKELDFPASCDEAGPKTCVRGADMQSTLIRYWKKTLKKPAKKP